MEDDTTRRTLHDIAARADHAGHVILESDELGFANSGEGRRWLQPLDPDKRLYKLNPEAAQQVAM